jgi:hypothetical protein
MGAALGLAARDRMPRAAWPGVRATATRHSSDDCGAGKRGRARAVALRCRGAEIGARGWQMTRGSGAVAGGRKEEKGRRGGWRLCRGAGDAAEASGRERAGVAGGRKEGES